MKNSTSSRIMMTLAVALLVGCSHAQKNVDIKKLLSKSDTMELIEADERLPAAPVLE